MWQLLQSQEVARRRKIGLEFDGLEVGRDALQLRRTQDSYEIWIDDNTSPQSPLYVVKNIAATS